MNVTSFVVNLSSFLFFKLLFIYNGLKSNILLPFNITSPTSGHVYSSAPVLPSNLIHLTSTECYGFLSPNWNVNVLVGACYVGLNGIGSHKTSTILCIGSILNTTHSGHINYETKAWGDIFIH